MPAIRAVWVIEAKISGSWVDLTDDVVLNTNAEGGLGGNSPTDLVSGTDTFNFDLKNNDPIGKYSFNHPDVLSGWTRGIPIRQVFTHNEIDFVKFKGYLEDSEPAGAKDERQRITVLGWMEQAQRSPIVHPSLLEDVTADEIVTAALAYSAYAPENTDFEEGLNVFKTAFDAVTEKTKIIHEIIRAATSEFSHAYIKRDRLTGETLRLESALTRNGHRELTQYPIRSGYLKKEDGFYLLKQDGGKILLNKVQSVSLIDDDSILHYETSDGDNIINEAFVQAFPKRTDTVSIPIYETERRIFLPSGGGAITFRGFYSNPTGKATIHGVPVDEDGFTQLLIHADDSVGEFPPTFEDATGKTITNVNSDCQITNAIVKIGSGAVYLDGSTSYLTVADADGWDFGGDDFTIDWWEYRFASGSGMCFMNRDATLSVPPFVIGNSNGTSLLCNFSADGVSFGIGANKSLGAITLNTWNHFRVCRSGNNFYAFKNGVSTDSWTSSQDIFASSAPLYIGRWITTYLNAVIDEALVLKGLALSTSTASFTPPTSPYNVSGSYYDMRSNEDGTGTDLTSNLDATVEYGTEGATWTLENTSATDGWLQIRSYGYGIYSDSPIETREQHADSITAHGQKSVSIHQEYQQTIYFGDQIGKRIVEREHNPRLSLNRLYFTANKDELIYQAFLNLDIGDIIPVFNTEKNIDSWHYINGWSYETRPAGVLFFDWSLKEALTIYKGLSFIGCEFTADGQDIIDFGVLKQVNNVLYRAYSVWIYLDTDAAVYVGYNQEHIMGAFSDFAGCGLGITNGRKVQYYQKGTAAPGIWNTPSNSVPLTTWTHILAVRDASNPANAPTIYINGVSQTLTNTNAQSGATQDESGCRTQIGNINTVTITRHRPFDGKIKDARIYNMNNATDTAAALAAGITAEGAGGTGFLDGVVFQAFGVRDADYANYENLVLTSDDKLLDVYGGFVGNPQGVPVARYI